MASRVEHIARFAVQDWRTSKVRARSARTQDPMLRTVYLEVLFALYEAGGSLPADPECLADTLLLPAEEVARCLPILLKIGTTGRGGLVQNGNEIHNLRVDEDLSAAAAFREGQRRKGQARQQPRVSTGSAAAEHRLEPAQPIPKPMPTPKPKETLLDLSGNGNTLGAEAASQPSPQTKPLLIFPCTGAPSTWSLMPTECAEWAELFPSLDILAESRKALAWVKANQKRRKTAGGMPKFLVGWFSTASDRGNGGREGPLLNLQPRQGGENGLEQYRLQVLDKLKAMRGHRGERWFDEVCEKLPRATTRSEIEALLP